MLRPLLLLLPPPVLADADQAPGFVTPAACAGWKVATPGIISQPGVASPQSDFYALGAVGYFLVTGQ
jgi:hypothetical protein